MRGSHNNGEVIVDAGAAPNLTTYVSGQMPSTLR